MAASSPTWCARACISCSAEALFPTAGRTFVRIVEMKDLSSHRARVLRYGGDAGARVEDQLAAEEPLEIRIAGQPLTLMMRTPGHDRDLALGFLFGEGIIRSADDVTGLTVVPNGEHPDLENVIDVALSPSAPGVDQRWQRNFLSASSCGLCGVSSIEAIHEAAPPLPDDDLSIDPEVIYGLDARLRAEQAIFSRTGGLHEAGAGEDRLFGSQPCVEPIDHLGIDREIVIRKGRCCLVDRLDAADPAQPTTRGGQEVALPALVDAGC